MNVFIPILKLLLLIGPLIAIGVYGLIRVKKEYEEEHKGTLY